MMQHLQEAVGHYQAHLPPVILLGTDTTGSTGTQSGNGYATIAYGEIIPVPNPEPATFAYTGAVQEYTVTKTGKYKLEVWGAQRWRF